MSSAKLAELALVNEVDDQLTHQVDDVITDQLMTTSFMVWGWFVDRE